MTNSRCFDFLLVGQGLAGTIMAIKLLWAGKKLLVIDNRHQRSSSMVAAGLINPVTGKRLLMHPDTPACLPAAQKFYREMEQRFACQLFHEIPMQRILRDSGQLELALTRKSDPDYQSVLGDLHDTPGSLSPFASPHGYIEQLKTGFLDIPLLLEKVRANLQETGSLLECKFDPAKLKINRNHLRYEKMTFDQAIFCEGYQAMHNPWFEWLPFQPAKGDILTVQFEQRPTEKIINKGTWLLPTSDGNYKTGATSHWTFEDDKPEAQDGIKAENQFKQLFDGKPPAYRITRHQAGIRPATRDKNPFVGHHPQFEQLMIFNGFGARGSLTIPYYAKKLFEHLLNGQPLPQHINIQRHNDQFNPARATDT
jgi:glycine/D-amino acid oxidase-like deaminating enzyme